MHLTNQSKKESHGKRLLDYMASNKVLGVCLGILTMWSRLMIVYGTTIENTFNKGCETHIIMISHSFLDSV